MLLVILCLCLNFFSPVYASEESERILAEISRVHVSMHHQIEEICAPDATHVVVLGITGSGKSTLIHALVGKNLMVTKGARKFQIDPDHLLPGFSIGHGVVSSTTLPVCWHDRESNIVYWDCPGFFDSRGAAQDIINAFATDVIFSLSGRKKVLLVLGAQELDLRGTEMKNRLEKIQRLLPQREELESCVHLVLSQTQSNPDFPYIDVLDGMTREIDDPLLRFFASSPNLVFEFPKPTHVGPYRLFQKRREVIQSLLGGDPLRIHHNIDLDAHIKMSLFQMMKKMGDVKIMIHQLSSLLQDSYRREDLDPLHDWHNRIDRVLRESSEQALSQRPLDFSSVIRGCVPEHMMTQPIKELLSKIYLNQQFFVFLGRVHQQGGWDATDIPNLFEIAQPFLHNIQKELETLIQQKQYIREQQEALERTRKLLEEERLNREKQQRAQRERLQEIEEEARLRISGIMLEIQRAKEIATEQNRKIVRLQQSSASAHTSFDSDKERLEGEIRDSKNQLGRLNEQMQTLQAHLKQIETEKKSIDCQNQEQEQILQSQHAELVRENVLLSTTIAELEAAINGNATRIRQIQEEREKADQERRKKAEDLAGAVSIVERPITLTSVIPEIARGHEDVYRRFMNGKLVYKPNKDNDVGLIELPIAMLLNVLEGTFDLSRCGNAERYLSINTGYKNEQRIEERSKLEIWFVPKFVVEKQLRGSARYIQPLISARSWGIDPWMEEKIGIFYTYPWCSYLRDLHFDYLTTESVKSLENQNLLELWEKAHRNRMKYEDRGSWNPPHCFIPREYSMSGMTQELSRFRLYL